MGRMLVGSEGLRDWADECSVNGGDGERLLSKRFLNVLTEGSRELFPELHNPHLMLSYLVAPEQRGDAQRSHYHSGQTTWSVMLPSLNLGA